jgi:hypothetical protein
MDLVANCSTPFFIISAGIWSVPGDLWLFVFSVANAYSMGKFESFKCHFCLFCEGTTVPGFILPMVGWLMNDEFDGMWKETAVA